mgnify:CR=1 FL=1|jgi:glycosyltransferase involved in cell wall biosynthesis
MKHRVLYVESSGDFLGGGQISLYELLGNLDRSVVEPILLCPGEGSLVSSVADLGIPVKILPLFPVRRQWMSFLKAIPQFRSVLRELRPDLIHANTSRAMLYSGLATLATGIPVVWHVRVIDSEGWYDRLLACLSDRIFACSWAVAARFGWLTGRRAGKVLVIHNGVNIRKFNDELDGGALRQEFGIPDDTPVVGIVGNLLAWKGQDTFLRAAALVARQMPHVRFLIVGDGEHRAALERLRDDLGLRSKAFFTGHRTDIPHAMAALDVAVHCSNSPEPFARVVIESMAAGKPIVAMNEGGILEIVEDGHSGVLVPPRDPERLASAVVDLLQDSGRRAAMGQAARRRVESHFTIEANARKTTEEYLKIIPQPGNRSIHPAFSGVRRA